MKKTLYDKLWDSHLIKNSEDGNCLIYIDRHLVHEVTSPQAFEGLKINMRKLWRPDSVIATADHNTPTKDWASGIKDPISKIQVETLDKNISSFGIKKYYPFKHKKQGIVHVMGPENGATLPGMTIVCGDSHTSTHGAFGSLAFGIGTSEVEHVLATQCLIQKKSKSMLVDVSGQLTEGVSSKDMILYIISKIGTAGGTGYTIEFSGEAINHLSMESRMTICNMSIEAGAKAGMMAVDSKTIEYLENLPLVPTGKDWIKACNYWKTLKSDEGAFFDKKITINAKEIKPQVTWGTSPEMVVDINGKTPDPNILKDEALRCSTINALKYMGLKPNTFIKDIFVDKVFIGSCTNSRIEDLRIAANFVKGEKIAKNIKLALVVPGSGLVKRAAEKEGLDKIFIESGFEWREPGCSMCLAMNDDRLSEGERCASTSNRNFEGRQGTGGRTHLVSPAMAAAAAINGHFTDVTTKFRHEKVYKV